MSEVHEALPNADFTTSDAGMKEVTVCAQTGLLPGDLCKTLNTVKVPDGSAPVLTCDGHIYMSVCTESGKLSSVFCPAESVQKVNAIDFAAENVTNGMGYTREVIVEPPTGKQLDEYEAQLAADPTAVAPTGTVIAANDSGASLPDLVAIGVCTLHEAPAGGIVDPSHGEGGGFAVSPEVGGEGDELPDDGEDADFLNRLLGIV